MKELAEVIESTGGDLAKVLLKRTSACGECKACSSDKKIIVTVKNKVNASIGDTVNIEIQSIKKSALFFVYVIPVILLFAGYGIGYLIFKKETMSALISMLLPAIYVISAVIIEKRKKSITGYIIDIVK